MELLSFIPLIILFLLFLIKVPVAYSLIIATGVYFLFINDNRPMHFIVQTIVASTESFPYLAIPFFICAGVLFNYSGITNKLIKLAEMLIGHVVGGLAQVNVLLSAMMGGLSGSANADAAMTTKILVPEMTKSGYDKGFSTALTSAAAVITPIIPPGIILILYAVAANVSIARMFFAGVLPGFLILITLLITVSIISKKNGYPPTREKMASPKEILLQLVDSFWALFLPLGILMGLRFGVFTPTEAGAISVLYAAIIGFFVYRQLKISQIPAILVDSATSTAGIMFIIAAASGLGTYLTWERIPMMLSEVFIDNISNPIVLLLVISLLLLIVGCFLEGGAAMILLAPLLIPAVEAFNIDLVHFGILMAVNLTISGITPPFGTMMFITTSIAKVPLEEYIKNIWPFLLALIVVLLILVFFPQVTIILPNLFL